MIIDNEQVCKVTYLARLELKPEEEEMLTTQLSSILEYFKQLSQLDTELVPPTTRAIDVSNVTREDSLELFPHREEILSCAPEQHGDFFKVPQIMSEE